MKRAARIATILAGYGAISFAILKILWRWAGVHFHSINDVHAPQAGVFFDGFLILLLALAGISLVREQLKYISFTVAISIVAFEIFFLHVDNHSVSHMVVPVSVLFGLISAVSLTCLAAARRIYRKRLSGSALPRGHERMASRS